MRRERERGGERKREREKKRERERERERVGLKIVRFVVQYVMGMKWYKNALIVIHLSELCKFIEFMYSRLLLL